MAEREKLCKNCTHYDELDYTCRKHFPRWPGESNIPSNEIRTHAHFSHFIGHNFGCVHFNDNGRPTPEWCDKYDLEHPIEKKETFNG